MALENKQQSDEELGCAECEGLRRCLAAGPDYGQLQKLREVVRKIGPIQPGEALFRMEAPFTSIYSIQSGSLKTETCSRDGAKIVTGFYFAGDLVGLDSIGENAYGNDAIALEPTRLCEMPFDLLQSACTDLPRLQCKMFALFGKRVRQVSGNLECGHKMLSEDRILKFLQYLVQDRGLVEKGILKLPMAKEDLSCYLNMRPESFSRALTRLQDKGLICKHKHAVELTEKGSSYFNGL